MVGCNWWGTVVLGERVLWMLGENLCLRLVFSSTERLGEMSEKRSDEIKILHLQLQSPDNNLKKKHNSRTFFEEVASLIVSLTVSL